MLVVVDAGGAPVDVLLLDVVLVEVVLVGPGNVTVVDEDGVVVEVVVVVVVGVIVPPSWRRSRGRWLAVLLGREEYVTPSDESLRITSV